MKHILKIREEGSGFYTVLLDGVALAWALTYQQMDWFQSGIVHGVEKNGGKIEYDENFYSVMAKKG